MKEQPNHVLEVVIFTVKNDQVENITDLRKGLYEVIKTLPGWVAFKGYKPIDDSRVFADLVTWDSYDSAQAAAQVVTSDPRFMPYMSAIEDVTFMGHLQPDVMSH